MTAGSDPARRVERTYLALTLAIPFVLLARRERASSDPISTTDEVAAPA